jgi:tetratricopeptide (TPR) repeat protein
VIDKMKEMARSNEQLTYLQQALFFEKKIEGLFITRSMREKAQQLSKESDETNSQLALVNRLSNLSLQLYGWYIAHGHVRNQKETDELKKFLEDNLPEETKNAQGFYERLYLYQSYCWYAFIRQDFLQYYRYTQKWVDLFAEYPHMYDLETAHYIKGMHNLMGAHFDLRNAKKLQESIEEFEKFSHRKVVKENEINRVLVFVYLATSRINSYFLEGNFSEGLKQVPNIEEKLKEFELYIDRHRILVFYYKIACLYFGAGKNEKAIQYLNKIINWKVDLRTDLQCYARLLHLIAHYELGNFDLLEYLTKSVYRFMAKMESLSAVEEEMFHFLRRSFQVNAHALRLEFEKLLEKLKKYENNPLETRAFSYLDVISWLESKINNVPVQDVIREKYLQSKKK